MSGVPENFNRRWPSSFVSTTVGANAGRISRRVVQGDLRADAGAFGRPQHRPPVVGDIFLEQQDFKLAAGTGIRAAQPRGNDARVVQDQHVAGAQKFQEIAESPVFDAARSSRCKTSSRDSSRRGAGCCAINSGGNTKSKSAVRIPASFEFQVSRCKWSARRFEIWPFQPGFQVVNNF